MKKDKKFINIILIPILILIVYLILDYINLPALIGIKIENINMDVFSLIVNAVIVIVLYIISFIYIDNRQNLKDKNARETVQVLLNSTYQECLDNLKFLDNRVMIRDYIIPKIDGNKTDKDNRVINNLQTLPFKTLDTIMSFSLSGYVEKSEMDQYLKIKKEYQYLVSIKITFFDLVEPETEDQKEMFNDIQTRDSKLKDRLNNILGKIQ